MTSVTLTEAKAHLSALFEQAARGEPVCIIRRGKPIAQITPIGGVRKPIDIAALRELSASMPGQLVSAGNWPQKVRNEERF